MAGRRVGIGKGFAENFRKRESSAPFGSSSQKTHRGTTRMKKTLIRYKTRPEDAGENQRLIEGVFRDLQTRAPRGFRYLVLRLEDDTFVHIKMDDMEDADPIHVLDAFKAFQSELKGRCVDLPKARQATVVGNYRMLGE
jgi:hypothetical protein